MLREYEFTVIYTAQGSPENFKSLVERYEAILLKGGGEIIKKSEWGVKRLAFPINKQFRGRYMHYDLTCSPEALKECERLMRIDDGVLRYFSVRIGENVDVAKRKVELAKAEARAAAAPH